MNRDDAFERDEHREPDDPMRLVRLDEVMALFSIKSPTTIREWVKRGLIPKPIDLKGRGRLLRWRLGDLMKTLKTFEKRGGED
jgi:predicted DNA-binding transcriptional regulator AlpA